MPYRMNPVSFHFALLIRQADTCREPKSQQRVCQDLLIFKGTHADYL